VRERERRTHVKSPGDSSRRRLSLHAAIEVDVAALVDPLRPDRFAQSQRHARSICRREGKETMRSDVEAEIARHLRPSRQGPFIPTRMERRIFATVSDGRRRGPAPPAAPPTKGWALKQRKENVCGTEKSSSILSPPLEIHVLIFFRSSLGNKICMFGGARRTRTKRVWLWGCRRGGEWKDNGEL